MNKKKFALFISCMVNLLMVLLVVYYSRRHLFNWSLSFPQQFVILRDIQLGLYFFLFFVQCLTLYYLLRGKNDFKDIIDAKRRKWTTLVVGLLIIILCLGWYGRTLIFQDYQDRLQPTMVLLILLSLLQFVFYIYLDWVDGILKAPLVYFISIAIFSILIGSGCYLGDVLFYQSSELSGVTIVSGAVCVVFLFTALRTWIDHKDYRTALIALLCVSLAISTVALQFEYAKYHRQSNFFTTGDLKKVMNVVSLNTAEPTRYRLLSNFGVYFCVKIYGGLFSYKTIAFILRSLQNLAIFLLAFKYLSKLKVGYFGAVLGCVLLSYSMGTAFFMADLNYYTYTEIVFILAAGVLIFEQKYLMWLPVLTILAATNREGAVFIPIMLLSSAIAFPNRVKDRIFWVSVLLSVIGFVTVYFGLRLALGRAEYSPSRFPGVYPGIELLNKNLRRGYTWINLLNMFHILFGAALFIKYWGKILQSYLIFVLIPWFGAIFVLGMADESRMYLAPLILVVIPGFVIIFTRLSGINREQQQLATGE